jgi:ketosteroid isomerase-like protein
MTAPRGNGERILKLYEAFEEEGPEAVGKLIDETFDEDVEFIPLQTGEVGGRVYRGRDGMIAFFGEIHEALDDVRYETPQCHEVGDELVVLFTRLAGTDRDTRVPVRQDLSLVYEFAGGLVHRMTAYETPAEALEAAQRGHADA